MAAGALAPSIARSAAAAAAILTQFSQNIPEYPGIFPKG